MHPECAPDVPRMRPGCNLDVPQIYPGGTHLRMYPSPDDKKGIHTTQRPVCFYDQLIDRNKPVNLSQGHGWDIYY